MAKRGSSSPPPQPPPLSPGDMEKAIARFRRRIVDLEAFDPKTVQSRSDSRIRALEASINQTLIETFGRDTPEYRIYSSAALLDRAPLAIGYRTPLHEVVEGLIEGKEQAIALLNQAIRFFEEKLADLTGGDATGHTARDVPFEVRHDYAFIAMPMDDNDHQLVDVLDTIKSAAEECGIVAERIDDEQRNERITGRMLENIRKAEFLIVDLTHERPSVYYEAGYAERDGKSPIFVARRGTNIHFDVQDFPIIFFNNMKELREGLTARLRAIRTKQSEI
jgi:hypothetical protein